ncbi:MAG: HAD hydrolase-like protein [Myxococcales bacterium]|nr:HAD hydrolase-like protein [Myxococcales bacterium]
MARIRAVMFDLDGTLIDTMGGFADLAAEVMQKRLGLELASARRRYLETSGIPFRQQLEVIAPGHAENQASSDEFETRKRAVCDATVMDAETIAGLEALRVLGLKLIVSSNGAQHFVDEFAVREAFKFDLALGFEAAKNMAKGAPHVAHTRRELGLEVSELLFCGDSLKDGELADACGIPFVGRTGTFTREDFLRRDPAGAAVDSIPELARLLRAKAAA